jgi:hypothetical protein
VVRAPQAVQRGSPVNVLENHDSSWSYRDSFVQGELRDGAALEDCRIEITDLPAVSKAQKKRANPLVHFNSTVQYAVSRNCFQLW